MQQMHDIQVSPVPAWQLVSMACNFFAGQDSVQSSSAAPKGMPAVTCDASSETNEMVLPVFFSSPMPACFFQVKEVLKQVKHRLRQGLQAAFQPVREVSQPHEHQHLSQVS